MYLRNLEIRIEIYELDLAKKVSLIPGLAWQAAFRKLSKIISFNLYLCGINGRKIY